MLQEHFLTRFMMSKTSFVACGTIKQPYLLFRCKHKYRYLIEGDLRDPYERLPKLICDVSSKISEVFHMDREGLLLSDICIYACNGITDTVV